MPEFHIFLLDVSSIAPVSIRFTLLAVPAATPALTGFVLASSAATTSPKNCDVDVRFVTVVHPVVGKDSFVVGYRRDKILAIPDVC